MTFLTTSSSNQDLWREEFFWLGAHFQDFVFPEKKNSFQYKVVVRVWADQKGGGSPHVLR